MDLDRLKIISVVVHQGTKLKRFTPRAMGRASPKYDTLVHVEIDCNGRQVLLIECNQKCAKK